MPTEIPPPTLTEAWDLLIGGDPVTMQALDGTHGYVSGTSEFLDDLSGGAFLGDPEVLTGVTTTAGSLVADPATLDNIMAAQFVQAVVVYADTGVAATSRILTFIDKNVDNTAMNKEGDGTVMTAEGPSGLIARL